MTLKYCWLSGLLGKNFDEKNLHVPIDSYIIEALWKDAFWNTPDYWKNNDCRNKILNQKFKDGKYKIGKYASGKYESWSTWKEDEYKSYQTALRNYLKSQKTIFLPLKGNQNRGLRQQNQSTQQTEYCYTAVLSTMKYELDGIPFPLLSLLSICFFRKIEDHLLDFNYSYSILEIQLKSPKALIMQRFRDFRHR